MGGGGVVAKGRTAGTGEGAGRTVGSSWMKRMVQIQRQNQKRQATLRVLISSIDISFVITV
jgi:hypothetical protein